MKYYLMLVLLVTVSVSYGQKVTVTPSISPSLFQHNSSITVTYDVTGTSLANLTQAWIWVWIPNVNVNAKYNVNPATSAADAAKFTKTTANGKTLFTITFKPSDFFTQDISTQTSLGMLLKANDWPGGQTSDHIANFGFNITLTSPTQNPVFVSTSQQLSIQATAPVSTEFKLYVNNALVNTQTAVTSYTYNHTIAELQGTSEVRLAATSASGTAEISFQYIISSPSPVIERPTGIRPGVNYDPSNTSNATLCLWAPGKSSVHIRGDFNDWNLNLMNRDGEFFWIELEGLISGTEYMYQYLIDEAVWVADPYSDKVIDPDDQYIPSEVYPGLQAFPSEVLNSKWYFNRLSVFETGQIPFAWQVADFEKPAKEALVVYELLIRDFFESGSNTYKSVMDTIPYLKKLGVNAIELMPIMEFGGNNSWGYNPQFMFAPDKAYGSKDDFKRLVDACHQNGIAVILDIAMNHQDMPNPYLMMDFDFTTSKPKATNKWFNVSATHPFNVFFDMNHESSYTKQYLDTINHYWLNEYKVDGFRFDLSKGFTQVNNPNNVSAWSAYDETRIAILKRMADRIWDHSPDAYVILEHLSVNSEEKVLAEYRAIEGKGMMLWGNMNHAYTQAAMGYSESSDIAGVNFQNRGWTVPHLVSYMESHDEERMVYKNVTFGNVAGAYSTKELKTALKRAKAAATIFYTIPGPKMLWQFGELGYDYSINACENGTINNDCRTSPKPVVWEYQSDPDRESLYAHTADLIRLRTLYDVFSNGDAAMTSGTSLQKQVIIKNDPYTEAPTNADEMNAVVAVNFELSDQNMTITFPHLGTWYDYYKQTEVQVTSAAMAIQMKAGEYKIFTDVPIEYPIVTDIQSELNTTLFQCYPNPVERLLSVNSDFPIQQLYIRTTQGTKISPERVSENSWDVTALNSGLYIVEIITSKGSVKTKVIKK